MKYLLVRDAPWKHRDEQASNLLSFSGDAILHASSALLLGSDTRKREIGVRILLALPLHITARSLQKKSELVKGCTRGGHGFFLLLFSLGKKKALIRKEREITDNNLGLPWP